MKKPKPKTNAKAKPKNNVKHKSTRKPVGTQTRDPKTGRITGGIPPAGFHVTPENRNSGRWEYQNSYSYWLSKIERMTVEERKAFKKIPDDKMTVAMDLAWKHTVKAEADIGFAKERSDRTVGKAIQSIDHTTGGESMKSYQALTPEELRKLAG